LPYSHPITSFSRKIDSLTTSVLRPARCTMIPRRSCCWLWKPSGRNRLRLRGFRRLQRP
jgi:hypothetical protein